MVVSAHSVRGEVSIAVRRSARPKALRFTAFSMHTLSGCTHAPLPGSRAAVSTTARPSRATTRTSERRGSRCRQPRQVLTGASLLLHDGVGLNVDPCARQLRREAGILPLFADG